MIRVCETALFVGVAVLVGLFVFKLGAMHQAYVYQQESINRPAKSDAWSHFAKGLTHGND